MAGRVVAIDLGTYSVKMAVANAGWGHAALVDFVERRKNELMAAAS